jgi:hypothetical protein
MLENKLDAEHIWPAQDQAVSQASRWLDAEPRRSPNDAGYDPQYDPYTNEAYSLVNLRLGVTHGGLDLSAFVNNATRTNPRLGYFNYGPDNPLVSATAIRPLTMVLR